MALLEVHGLEKWYGRRQVVNGVDYEVNRGEVVGLLGPNGAGKTTSFRMTIGLITADGGRVLFDGQDVTNLAMYKRARAGMGYLAQDSSVFKQLSVEDNLMAILETRADMNRRQRKDRQNELLDQFGLTGIRRTKANRVSGGERRRLEIARSLITEPKLIMLDEPFAGIDPKTVAEIQDQIRNLVERYNIGILLTDHQFRETLEVTDRSYLIREGRVFAYGNREQIINNPDVRRYYIGDRFDVGHLLDRRRVHALAEADADDPSGRAAPEPSALGPTPDEARATLTALPPASVRPALRPEGVPAAGSHGFDAGLAALSSDPSPPPVAIPSSLTTPTPAAPPPVHDARNLERIFGGSVTVQGDFLIEQVEVEAPPSQDPRPPRPTPPAT